MSRYDYDDYYYPPSKSKGERIADAAKKCKEFQKKGFDISPVVLKSQKIAATFWGKAWCTNIESYRDYAYRLERGRSYVRSNSVIDLKIDSGIVRAQVMGSELYCVEVTIKPVAAKRWAAIRKACAGKIGSLIELLRGSISGEVMEVMTRHGQGLFPSPAEISFSCSCPDSATMCKHVAAVMYGIGNRLDTAPELLFLLRDVDTADLLDAATDLPDAASVSAEDSLASSELADVFGVELEVDDTPAAPPVKKPRGRPKKSEAKPKKVPAKKALAATSRAKAKPKAKPKTKAAAASKPRKTRKSPRPNTSG